jgi:hypothetical protein
MKEYLFIGERRSEQAQRNGWTWQQGVSTARFLFDSLRQIGIEPTEQEFINLWSDQGEIRTIDSNLKIVAMGKKVQAKLKELGIDHLSITHPAARGKIRNKELYTAKLREDLL